MPYHQKRLLWSRARLHQHLYKLLERPTTTLEFKAFRNGYAGEVTFAYEFPPSKIIIMVDGNTSDTIRHVLHELLHVVFSELSLGKLDDTLEEVLIVAFDHYIHDYVQASKPRRLKWEALIAQKLKESEALLADVPLEEQVARKDRG